MSTISVITDSFSVKKLVILRKRKKCIGEEQLILYLFRVVLNMLNVQGRDRRVFYACKYVIQLRCSVRLSSEEKRR